MQRRNYPCSGASRRLATVMSAAVHMGRISAFGMTIPESDHAVPALQNVFFPDDAAVEIAAQVDKGLIAVAGVLAVNHPLFWAIMGDGQVVLHQKLKELCSENLVADTESIDRIRTAKILFSF